MADYATLLRDHVTLKVRSIDRIFLQAYVPKLQSVGQVCRFLRWQKGYPIPSSAAFGKIGEAYVKGSRRSRSGTGPRSFISRRTRTRKSVCARRWTKLLDRAAKAEWC